MNLIVGLEFIGALGILVPFALFQIGRTSQHGLFYLVANAFGALLLTVVAYIGHQWGFVILQGVWAIAACYGIVGWMRRRPEPGQGGGQATEK